MDIKIPKTVMIDGRSWKVKLNPKDSGGWFSAGKSTISVGTFSGMEHAWNIFLHECAEAVATMLWFRYQKAKDVQGNGDYMFVMNHDQFEIFINQFSVAIRGNQ